MFAKFNLKIHYPLPYEREVWHYQKANVDQIRQAIREFPWDNRFADISVNEQVQLFIQIFQNIISNYITNETFPHITSPLHPPLKVVDFTLFVSH